MKKFSLAMLLLICLCCFLSGCSEVRQPLYKKNFLSTLFSSDQLSAMPLELDKETMQPALELGKSYKKEFEKLSKEQKDKRLLEQAVAEAAAKYLPQAKALQSARLAPRDFIVAHYPLARYAQQYLDNLILLLEAREGLPKAQDVKLEKQLRGRISGADFNLRNAILGYEHEFALVTTGKGKYEFNLPTFRELRKGMTYWQIADTLKMPGLRLKSSRVLVNNKPVWQEDWLWQNQSAFIYVTMQGGKAVSLRQEGLW